MGINAELLEDAFHGGGGGGDVVGIALAGRNGIEQIDGRKRIRGKVGRGFLIVVVDGGRGRGDGLFRGDGLEAARWVGIKGKRLGFGRGARLLEKRFRRRGGGMRGPIVLRGGAGRRTVGEQIANPAIGRLRGRSGGLLISLAPFENLGKQTLRGGLGRLRRDRFRRRGRRNSARLLARLGLLTGLRFGLCLVDLLARFAGGGQAHNQQEAVAHTYDQEREEDGKGPKEELQTDVAQPTIQPIGDEPFADGAAGISDIQLSQGRANTTFIGLKEAGGGKIEAEEPHRTQTKTAHTPMQKPPGEEHQEGERKPVIGQAGEGITIERHPRAKQTNAVGGVAVGRRRRVAQPRDVVPIIGDEGQKHHRGIEADQHAEQSPTRHERRRDFGDVVRAGRVAIGRGSFGHGQSFLVTRERLVRPARRRAETTSIRRP